MKMCREHGIVNEYMWTGLTRKTGSWKRADGRSLSGFQFDWIRGRPISKNGYDVMVIYCYEYSNIGQIYNEQKTSSYKFVCQN